MTKPADPVTVFSTHPRPKPPKEMKEESRKYLDNFYEESYIDELFA